VTCHSQNIGNYNSGSSRCAANLPETNMKITSLTTFVTIQRSGFIYNNWDAHKIQMCRCDVGYSGSDCSVRVSPRGDDPMTTVKAESMKQVVQISGTITGGEFFMKYHDAYGGVWVTDTIGDIGAGTDDDDDHVAGKVQLKLRDLPNGVLRDVKVTAIADGTTHSTCHRFEDGVQHFSPHDITRPGSSINSKQRPNWCQVEDSAGLPPSTTSIDLEVDFGTKPGRSGVQYLLEVDVSSKPPGSYPVSSGVTGTSIATSVAELNYNDNLGNLSELSYCSDRGLDNGNGECDCFDGYSGAACEAQESLV